MHALGKHHTQPFEEWIRVLSVHQGDLLGYHQPATKENIPYDSACFLDRVVVVHVLPPSQ